VHNNLLSLCDGVIMSTGTYGSGGGGLACHQDNHLLQQLAKCPITRCGKIQSRPFLSAKLDSTWWPGFPLLSGLT